MSFELILSESELDTFFTRESWMKQLNVWQRCESPTKFSGGVAGVLGARLDDSMTFFPFRFLCHPLSSTGSVFKETTFGEGSFFGSRSLRPWSRRVR